MQYQLGERELSQCIDQRLKTHAAVADPLG